MAKQDEVPPPLVTLEETRAAEAALRQAADNGELRAAELDRRITAVKRATTPRELWKASGGRAGSRRRSDLPQLRNATWAMIATVVFALVAMVVVLWGTIIYQGGRDALPF
jgi:hypothetical protein